MARRTVVLADTPATLPDVGDEILEIDESGFDNKLWMVVSAPQPNSNTLVLEPSERNYADLSEKWQDRLYADLLHI